VIGIDASAEATELCRAWFRAAMETDDAWMQENVAAEFHYLMGGGELERKDRVITMSHEIVDKRYELLECAGHRYGDVCVAFGTYFAQGTIPAGLAPPAQVEKYARGVRVRFSSVWVDHDGAPRCVLMQSTTIQPAP
jgi:hypothetical protein